MKFSKNTSVVAFFIFFTSHLFAINRILEMPHLNNGRCLNRSIPADACTREQTRALSSHCISLDEYNTLVQMSYFPSCISIDGQMELVSWCTCGCFEESTRLFSLSGSDSEPKWNVIKDIVADERNYFLWSLSDDATIFDFKTIPRKIVRNTQGPEQEPLIYLHTDANNTLGLTSEHAVLLWSGEMVAAKSLIVGQMIVSSSGKPLKITKIELKMTEKNVVNILTEGESMLAHIVLAEGIVVGDLAWQNSLQFELNAIVVRQD